MRKQQINGTEQLAARSQASAGFAGALCHSTNLPTPLVKHRQDQVRLFELRLIEHETSCDMYENLPFAPRVPNPRRYSQSGESGPRRHASRP